MGQSVLGRVRRGATARVRGPVGWRWLVVAMLLPRLVGCAPAAEDRDAGSAAEPVAAPLLLLAAANAGPAAREVAARWTDQTGQRVNVSVAGTNVLASQVLAGLEADVIISADARWMDELVDAGRVTDVRPLLANRMVLVVPAEADPAVNGDGSEDVGPGAASRALERLVAADFRRVALAGPSVPAGRYAEAAMRAAGVYRPLVDRDAIVRGPNVRAVLRYVTSGAVDAGFVYASDAAGEPRVRVVATVNLPGADAASSRGADGSGGGAIVMPSAIVLTRDGVARPGAERLHAYLHGTTARAIFAAHGHRLASPSSGAAAPPRTGAAAP